MVHDASEDEQQVGQAIHVLDQRRLDGLDAQADDPSLGATADRSRQMQQCAGRAAARQDETTERRQLRLELVDALFDLPDRGIVDLCLDDAGGDAVTGVCQLGADGVQIALEGDQQRIEFRIDAGRAGDADGGVELVDLAVGIDARIRLRDTRAVEETGLTTVSAARVDLHATIILAAAAGDPLAAAVTVVARDTNFYYSFLVLPPHKRRAIVAVWDFCRAVDDSVDGSPDQAAACTGLALWRDEVARVFEGRPAASAQGNALAPLVSQFTLPRAPFDALVDGVEMDLGHRRYQTFDELREYCYRVASTVGLICLEIFGYRNPASRDYAVDLGIALQLTNILRDVPVDFANGRLYVPLDELARFGCTEDDVRAGRLDARMTALLAHQAARAREYYRRAAAKLPGEDRGRLVAAEIMSAIYQAILGRIEARRYDVFSEVVRVPRPRRALIAAATWTRVRLGANGRRA